VTVYLEATITVHPLGPKSLAAFVETYASQRHVHLARHGFDLVGAWQQTGGATNTVVQLYAFESLAAFEHARDAAQRDAAFAGAVGRVLQEIRVRETVSMGSALKLPDGTPSPPAGVFARHIVRLEFASRPAGVEAIVAAARAGPRHGLSLRHAYETDVGRRGSFTLIWGVSAPVEHTFAYGAPGIGAAAGSLSELAVEEELYLLHPLPYSPQA
jgi:hypothetical protein